MKNVPATRQYRPKGHSVRVLKYRVKNATANKAATKAHTAPTRAWARTPSPSGPEQVGDLDDPCEKDHRRCEQERETGRVLVVESPDQARDDRDAGPADTSEQRQHLSSSDYRRFFEVKLLAWSRDGVVVRGPGRDVGRPPRRRG